MTSINIEISEVGEQGTIYHANGRIESITLSAERVARKTSQGAILSALRPMETAVQMRMKL